MSFLRNLNYPCCSGNCFSSSVVCFHRIKELLLLFAVTECSHWLCLLSSDVTSWCVTFFPYPKRVCVFWPSAAMQSRRGQHRRPGCDSVDKRCTSHLLILLFFTLATWKDSVVSSWFEVQKTPSWVECGWGCKSVFKDNCKNWGWTQLGTDFVCVQSAEELSNDKNHSALKTFVWLCKSSESLHCLPCSAALMIQIPCLHVFVLWLKQLYSANRSRKI